MPKLNHPIIIGWSETVSKNYKSKKIRLSFNFWRGSKISVQVEHICLEKILLPPFTPGLMDEKIGGFQIFLSLLRW